MKNFSELKSIHILGVCGTLMAPFAAYLKKRGLRVTGSDQNVYPPMSDLLNAAKVEILSPYSADNLSKLGSKPDLVIVGNVIPATNPEMRAVKHEGLPITSLPEFLESTVLQSSRNLVIAGTHGKTTTSSMLTHVLRSLGKDPSYLIGGVAHDLPNSFEIRSENPGQLFVMEGDEYDTVFWDKVPKFFHYLPDDVLLTSVEFDHADIYSDEAAVVKAFEGLFQKVRKGGSVVGCVDYSNVQALLAKASQNISVFRYGTHPSTDAVYFPLKVAHHPNEVRFEIHHGKRGVLANASIQVPGNHNVLNALSVWIECVERLGLSSEATMKALKSFRGVKRRQEIKGEFGGVTLVDDFAHHPTAVRETLSAIKNKFPDRRILTVFEPRSATSRRKIFQAQYAEALSLSHFVFVARPYDQSKIPNDNQFSSEMLVDDLAEKGVHAHGFSEIDEGVALVKNNAKPGDVVVVLSNGGFGGFVGKVAQILA